MKEEQFGIRTYGLEKCLPILKEFIPEEGYRNLKTVDTPLSIIKDQENERIIQF